MSARILILSGIQLSTNPRVVKEANTLAAAGYEVEVLGALLEPALGAHDRALHEGRTWRYTELVTAGGTGVGQRLKWLAVRVRRRFWREMNARFGVESPNQLGYVAPEMLRYAIDYPADLIILHNPPNLWTGTELILRGRKVAVDMEDWYSEDVTGENSGTYPVKALKRWEGVVLRAAEFSTTTSLCLSAALAHEYACRAPEVLYNSFSLRERAAIDGEMRDRRDLTLPSICWFSQVIGPNRGLETLMAALHHVALPMEIHLRGRSTMEYQDFLLSQAPEAWRSRIYFHASIPHADLISRIAEHDLALAMEIPYCRNKELTVSNKLLFYLLAGLPVLASETAGQREAANMSDGAIAAFPADDAPGLAASLSHALSDRKWLREGGDKAVLAAERTFCWENSEPVLLDQVARALRQETRR